MMTLPIGLALLAGVLPFFRLVFSEPIPGSILVLAAVDYQITGAFRLLLVYGIGAALPLLAIAHTANHQPPTFQNSCL